MSAPNVPGVPATRRVLSVGGDTLGLYHDLNILQHQGWGQIDRLPFSLRILLESMLRHQEVHPGLDEAVRAVAGWQPHAKQRPEVPFYVARILAPDASGIPLLADLAAMRDAAAELGASDALIEPVLPVDLVVDHSLQVDVAGSADALARNAELEFERNEERYQFIKWAAGAYERIRVIPPGNGILHQLNIELLASQVREEGGWLFPDSVVGPDSHTAMINGLGVLGWGVGGIEAEAAMLGQPLTFEIPDVVGIELVGRLAPGVMATDLALYVTERLRKMGVVGKFVEFYGDGASGLSVPDRCTIANMAPEYGATVAFFAVDHRTVEFLRNTGRPSAVVQRVEAYWRAQGMYGIPRAGQIDFSVDIRIDLASIVPSVSGPSRPQDRVSLDDLYTQFTQWLVTPADRGGAGREPSVGGSTARDGTAAYDLDDGDIVIAAITSCANTSNPALLIAAGLLARNAVARGLLSARHVKTSFTPGSKVAPSYLRQAGLMDALEQLGFQVAGYGCATCMGNSGPLPPEVDAAIAQRGLVAVSVLSGNRNFEGRIHPAVRANYLMSPPLVVAFAIAGRIIDVRRTPLGHDRAGVPVFLSDLWPDADEIEALLPHAADGTHFIRLYRTPDAIESERWRRLNAPTGHRYAWDSASSYLRPPPFFKAGGRTPEPPTAITDARALAILGDSITTDHISPGGNISPQSEAGRYLMQLGVPPDQFNTYVARRGNHEVMVRGTFANPRLRNRMADGATGGFTRLQPSGALVSIYEAARTYARLDVPLVIVAGKDYGTGSSRDWAAKGTRLLGVRVVLASSFERIHRSNLIGMGVLPCEFYAGEDASTLKLDGSERFSLPATSDPIQPRQILQLLIHRADGTVVNTQVRARIDTQLEAETFRHGGVLPFVLRKQLAGMPT